MVRFLCPGSIEYLSTRLVFFLSLYALFSPESHLSFSVFVSDRVLFNGVEHNAHSCMNITSTRALQSGPKACSSKESKTKPVLINKPFGFLCKFDSSCVLFKMHTVILSACSPAFTLWKEDDGGR